MSVSRGLLDRDAAAVRPGVRVAPQFLALAGIFLLALLLRVVSLGEESLWLDEARSVQIARQAWPAFLREVSTSEVNMVLYYVLLRGWLTLGDSEVAIRSLSVLFSLATVPVLYALGTRLFGAGVGLVGALLLAVNAFHVAFAQEARGYSLVVFLATLSSLLFADYIRAPSRTRWWGYVLAAAAAAYSHLFGALIPAAHWASAALLRFRGVPWRGVAASGVAVAALIMPLGAFAILEQTGHSEWILPPTARLVPGIFAALSGAGGFSGLPGGGELVSLAAAGRRLLLLAYAAACTLAVVAAAGAWKAAKPVFDRWRYGFLLAWLGVPIALAFAISLWKPVLVTKYLIVSLPALVLLAAVGLVQIRRRALFAAVLVSVVLLALYGVTSYYRYAEKEDWRAATDFLFSQARPGDAVMFYAPYVRSAFDYYHTQRGRRTPPPRLAFPASLDDLGVRYQRVWLVLSHDAVRLRTPGLQTRREELLTSILASLDRGFVLEAERRFTEVRVRLYERRSR